MSDKKQRCNLNRWMTWKQAREFFFCFPTSSRYETLTVLILCSSFDYWPSRRSHFSGIDLMDWSKMREVRLQDLRVISLMRKDAGPISMEWWRDWKNLKWHDMTFSNLVGISYRNTVIGKPSPLTQQWYWSPLGQVVRPGRLVQATFAEYRRGDWGMRGYLPWIRSGQSPMWCFLSTVIVIKPQPIGYVFEHILSLSRTHWHIGLMWKV